MCNADDDAGERQSTKLDKGSKLGQKCVKCDQPGVLITRIHDAFCKSCFQVYVIHKFRAAIGKSKLIREGEHVLMAFSGGSNSAALLHLIEDGLSQRAHRKLRFIPTLLHVDECGVLDISESERQEMRKKVAQIMYKSGFTSYITSLEQGVDIDRNAGPRQDNSSVIRPEIMCLAERVKDPSDYNVTGLPHKSQSDRLKTFISNTASVTSQEDVLRNLRTQLIAAVARQMGFSKVLTADCSTRLSVRILSDVAQGRGAQLPLNTGFSDQRNGDVMFIRPVRDLNAKELAMYNSLFGAESVFIPSITTKGTSGCSIERLTETFVMGLQADFPSTVSNIVRTSEKLGLPDLTSSIKCSFCQSPLDTNVGKASALHAIEFSRKLSCMAHAQAEKHGQSASQIMHGLSVGDHSHNSIGPDSSSAEKNTSPESHKASCTTEELIETLCFGCRMSLHNYSDDVMTLPTFITKDALEIKKQQDLRDQISSFLLSDDEDDR